MNYYQHHIGDFIRDTSRLSDAQSMAYLRLIWMYYETEWPLENDIDAIAFKIGANASDVHQILKHFFFLHDDGLWHQARCDKEILAYRTKSAKAKKGASARWDNANAMRTHSECNADETVSDANQEPITNIKPKEKDIAPAKAVAVLVPKQTPLDLLMAVSGMTEQVAKDHLAVRKAKKSPLTETALALIAKEAGKAGITTAQAVAISTARGWVSFKADWIRADDNQKTHAERTQDFKDQQAAKAYAPLLNANQETLAKWGLVSNE